MKTIIYEFFGRVHLEKFDHHERLGSFFFEMLGLVAIIAVITASAVSIALLKYINKKQNSNF